MGAIQEATDTRLETGVVRSHPAPVPSSQRRLREPMVLVSTTKPGCSVWEPYIGRLVACHERRPDPVQASAIQWLFHREADLLPRPQSRGR